MEKTVADTIREITKNHIDRNEGLVMGQCLSAVGWVQNTVPEQEKGIVELPMTDVAGAGFAVGASLIGGRPIFVLRFQSFLWLNASPLVNYAAKAKEVFGYPAPVFIRAIASEGGGSGPIHTNCYHSIFAHMPGLPIVAPMTPKEYEQIWDYFITNYEPMLVSEHRRSYKNCKEFENKFSNKSDITIMAISASRFEAIDAIKNLEKEGYIVDFHSIVWIKPFFASKELINSLKRTKKGIVLDSAYEIASVARSIAYELMLLTDAKIYVMGMLDKSPGAFEHLENGTPKSEKIIEKAKYLIENNV